MGCKTPATTTRNREQAAAHTARAPLEDRGVAACKLQIDDRISDCRLPSQPGSLVFRVIGPDLDSGSQVPLAGEEPLGQAPPVQVLGRSRPLKMEARRCQLNTCACRACQMERSEGEENEGMYRSWRRWRAHQGRPSKRPNSTECEERFSASSVHCCPPSQTIFFLADFLRSKSFS
jgi:hypothetical protein